MSLHTLAHHLQSAGRGEDKVLVHMTPGEVKGLQALAMAQGGSLTINPQTGLPEAGILSSLLPMLAGFALGPAGFGLMSSLQAGLTVGALTGVATGSLKKGLMAGMGAYSGSGLGEGLMAQGANAPVAAGANTPAMNVGNAGVEGMKQNLYGPGQGIFSTTPGGMTGYSSTLAPVTPTTTPFTSANLPEAIKGGQFGGVNAATTEMVYPPGHPLYQPVQSEMNLASQAFKAPSSADIVGKTVSPELTYPPGHPLYNPAQGQMTVASKIWKPPGSVPTDVVGLPKADTYIGSVQHTGFHPTENLVSSKISQTPVFDISKSLQNQAAVAPRSLLTEATVNPTDVVGPRSGLDQLTQGAKTSFSSMEGLKGLYNAMPQYSVIAGGLSLADSMKPEYKAPAQTKSLIRPYDFEYGSTDVSAQPYSGSGERVYFNPVFTARSPYEAPGPEYAAKGGLMGYAVGGPVEQMAAMNSVGANTGYPMANLQTSLYANPSMQRPEAMNVIAPSADAGVGAYTGEARFARGGGTAEPESSGYSYSYDPKTMQFTQTGAPTPVDQGPFNLVGRALAQGVNQPQTTPNGTVSGGIATPVSQPAAQARSFVPNINIPAYQKPEQQSGLGGFYDYMNQQLSGLGGYGGYSGYAAGGISTLGGYSDGGRLLRGPGDGVSDSIPASIGDRQPARLADGEFVVPARIVSEIGNGSTEAGARKLYEMMDRVQRARRKTTGKNQVARNTKAEDMLPA